MGKYYFKHEKDLYVFVTGDDVLIDLSLFPSKLELFGNETSWRIRDNMAIVTDAKEDKIEKAEIILNLNGYKKVEVSKEKLEKFYVEGDVSTQETEIEISSLATESRLELKTGYIEKDIIMPPYVPIDPHALEKEVKHVELGPPISDKKEYVSEELALPLTPIKDIKLEEASHGLEYDDSKIMFQELKESYYNLVYSKYGNVIGEKLEKMLNALAELWSEFKNTSEKIFESPHYTVSTSHEKKHIHKLEKDDLYTSSILKDLKSIVTTKGWDTPEIKELIGEIPIRVMVEESHVNYDVFENRYLKYQLEKITSTFDAIAEIAQIRDVHLRKKLRKSSDSDMVDYAKEFLSNNETIDKVENIRKDIVTLLSDPKTSFLEKVNPIEEENIQENIQFSKPEYNLLLKTAQIYHDKVSSFIPLFKALKIDLKDPNELYSKWCFTKILETFLNKGLEIEQEDLTEQGVFSVPMEMGDGTELTLKNGRFPIKIAYQKTYKRELPYGSYSSPKKVTISVEIFEDGDVPKIILFDPIRDREYSEEKFVSQDLDRLHVLHDAIVDLRAGDLRKIVIGVAILHPSEIEPISFHDLHALPLKTGDGTRNIENLFDWIE